MTFIGRLFTAFERDRLIRELDGARAAQTLDNFKKREVEALESIATSLKEKNT